MDASPELFVTLPNKVRLCYQTFGNPTDPAVIFIAGHGGSLLEWNEDMLRLFSPAPSRRYLIRFDARDTGLSTEFPVPAGYDLSDMAGDVDGLIAHLGLSSKGVHLVGASMGGPIAYILAARNPQQVRSLTLLYASPGASEELPLKPLMDLPMPPMGFGDMKREYVKFNMAQYDALVTQPNAEDRAEYEALVTRVTEREMRAGTLYSKGPNHGAAGFAPRPGVEILKDVTSPSTVIQAAHDQFFGVEHGEALAKGLPNSEYVLLEDVGHELPRRIWGRLAEVLLQTWKRGDDAWVAE
ncbi:hypothetical protein AK830_g7555 [Neonectria ditissima]|uniref:AB hydrolase-1 domain-containing protein n=1 Tax=Neonectria ditissima TaxID=78410 RepID=A0A0P7BG04_9HYPO|nr:hypothetical protein AK830_g7555 [Neonectria ditissima]